MDWLSQIFGTDFFLDGDSADPYKNPSLASSAQTRTMTMPMATAWIGYQKLSGPIFFVEIPLIPIKIDRLQDRPKTDR